MTRNRTEPPKANKGGARRTLIASGGRQRSVKEYMRLLLLMTIVLLALWSLSHFYFCYYSVYYKTHVPMIAIVEGVISLSYVAIPDPFPLMADFKMIKFEGNKGILPTLFPEFRIAVPAPGFKLTDGVRIGIPFWLLLIPLAVGLHRRSALLGRRVRVD